MRLCVLISTMNQNDYTLLEKMNIRSEAIVVNQCDHNSVEEFLYKGNKILWISVKERGVGLSRNTAWMRSDADIILFADDDIHYVDNYEEIVINAFMQSPHSDMYVFDVNILNDNRSIHNYRRIKKQHRLHWYNSMRYGACRFALRRMSLAKANVMYSLLFGGGALLGSGEDSLFIKECLNKRLKVYANPNIIADVDSTTSSWYKGNDDNYYIDKGALYYTCFPKIYPFLYVYYSLRNVKVGIKFSKCLKLFFTGRQKWRSL